MSSKSKTMGAGFACSTQSNVNVNQITFGSRKQGIPSNIGRDHWANRSISILANGTVQGRNTVFSMNQLGGVGAGNSQFRTANSYARKDGARIRMPYIYK